MTASTTISAGRKWSIIGLLCVAFVIAYFDRINLSMAMADEEFSRTFPLTETDKGRLSAAFFMTYTILQIPAGWFVDKFGVRWPYAGGLAAWSLVSALTAFITSIRQLFLIRLLLGVGEAPVTPAGMTWIRNNVAENQRGLVIGLYMAAAKVGPALGPIVAAFLIKETGWRNMFLILGLGGILWVVPWLMAVPAEPRRAPKKAGPEKAAPGVPFLKVIASPVIWGTFIGTFCYQYFVYYSLTWLPLYFRDARKLNLSDSGLFTGFSFGGMAIVATAAGWLADRMISRGRNPVRVRKAFIFGGFLVASTEIFGVLSESNDVSLFFAVFSLSGLGLMTANYWALTQTLIPGAAVGRIVGVQNCAANLPGIVAPWLTGWLRDATGGYEAPMYTILFFLGLGIASYLFLVREKYAPKEEENYAETKSPA